MFELFEYWRDYPPTHECLKLAHGIERKEAASAPKLRFAMPTPAGAEAGGIGNIGAMLQQFPSGQMPP